MGRDFLIPVRDGYAAHSFVGGNAFMLDLLRSHRDELGVEASVEDLARAAAATRHQLAERVEVRVGDLWTPVGDAAFDLIVSNPPYIATGEREPHRHLEQRRQAAEQRLDVVLLVPSTTSNGAPSDAGARAGAPR